MDKIYTKNEIIKIINFNRPLNPDKTYTFSEIDNMISKMVIEIAIFMSTDI